MLCGVAVGKTFTGSHFAIMNFLEHPELTGFIGANTFDQLSQATLRELMYWLDEYRIPYVIDRLPPPEWKAPRRFKSYKNIISVKIGKVVANAFLRVLADGNPLRGLEFSWYWLDETRDTPKNTHDIILSRLRENKEYISGLVTTTPRGEDWCWERFVKKADGILYDSIHVETREAVEYDLISEQFYHSLLSSYSPNMAAQELFARHISAIEGRCYYTDAEENREYGYRPHRDLPLVIGMDFNFAPAPMAWVVGQVDDDDFVHWFDELSDTEISSRDMARRLAQRYGDFFLQIYGDASGNRGTTSNAGVTDFNQIAEELQEAGVDFTIDVDQANPFVRDRVENMCRLLKDANGKVSMSYDPENCPLLAGDFDKVFWKNGKPSDGGDCNRTHAADGAGYAVWKLFPPGMGNISMGKNIPGRIAKMGSDR
jgi:hypothetical protein